MDDLDDLPSDTSDIDTDAAENRNDPSAASIFSLFQYRSANNGSSEANSSSDSDTHQDEEYSALDEHTRSLACEHPYLGDLEPIRGRVIMDDNSVQKIPVISLVSRFVLVPGQTFPLIINESPVISILKYAIEHNHIFSIIPAYLWNHRHLRRKAAVIGTTAEITAFGQTEEGFKIKAIGRQRYKIIDVKDELIGDRYILFAYVQILPEITLPHVLHDYQLTTLNRIRSSQRLKCLRREACQSQWPFWTYRLYDEKHIVKDIKKKLTSDFRMSKNIKYPDDATALFFQTLKSVPISPKLMLEGMALNNSIQRLNWLKEVLKPKSDRLNCAACKSATIGKSLDIFAMSNEGPHGTYINNGGYLHELITLKKVKHVVTRGTPETLYSWFPKYAWQNICCSKCQNDLGWKFVACEELLNPRFFYAVTNDAIRVKNVKEELNGTGYERSP